MSETRYLARHCGACGLRFCVAENTLAVALAVALALPEPLGAKCPKCGHDTQVDARTWTGAPAPAPAHAPTLALELLLDGVRSLRNVGAMLRTADGVGVAHVHLCGITPTPDHPGLAKTALGAERSVPWSYAPDASVRARELTESGRRLWALEGGPNSRSLFDPDVAAACGGTVVLVVGHEVAGVDVRVLDVCERVIHIPMQGIKTSLNAAVAFGVAAYVLRYGAA